MKKYIGKRIMISLVTLLIIILVLFMLLQLMPGSPFNDEKLTADQIAMMSKKYGLDKPLIVQFSLAQWEMSVQSFTSPAMAARNVLALWALPPETVHPETVPYLFSSPTMAPQPPAVVDLRSM